MQRVQASERLTQALAQARPDLVSDEGRLRALACEAARELRRWGHDGHELTLERVSRIPGAPGSSGFLHCLFWCESCHVSQLLALGGTRVR